MSKRKMNYNDMKEMLRNFNSVSESDKERLASINGMSVQELRKTLERNCYYLNNLGINQMKALKKDIATMSEENIAVVEEVNGCDISRIIKTLEEEITEYDMQMKKKREFDKAWKIRKEEVKNN